MLFSMIYALTPQNGDTLPPEGVFTLFCVTNPRQVCAKSLFLLFLCISCR